MYNLKQICSTCLCNNTNLITFQQLNVDIITFFNKLMTDNTNKLNIIEELNNQRNICENCYTKLNDSYIFWKQCLKNKIILENYISELKNSNPIDSNILKQQLSKNLLETTIDTAKNANQNYEIKYDNLKYIETESIEIKTENNEFNTTKLFPGQESISTASFTNINADRLVQHVFDPLDRGNLDNNINIKFESLAGETENNESKTTKMIIDQENITISPFTNNSDYIVQRAFGPLVHSNLDKKEPSFERTKEKFSSQHDANFETVFIKEENPSDEESNGNEYNEESDEMNPAERRCDDEYRTTGIYKSRKYVRKSSRQTWLPENMKAAIAKVMSGDMSYLRASKKFSVPQTTLETRVKKVKNGTTLEEASMKWLGRYRPLFNKKQESDIVLHIFYMQKKFFDFHINDLRSLAFELAEKYNIPNMFNKDYKLAPAEWGYSFLSRYDNIKLLVAEPKILELQINYYQIELQSFYDALIILYKKYNFTPDCVYNVDDTCIINGASEVSRILDLAEKRNMSVSISAKKGFLVSVETCINASGKFMPPMFVFPGEKTVIKEVPQEFHTTEFTPNGFVNNDVFLKWFKYFIDYAKPSRQKRVLLLLNGHATHTKCFKFVEMARLNHVIILSFPLYLTQKIQPLNISFMPSFTQSYSDEVTKWIKLKPDCDFTFSNVAKLYSSIYMETASVETAVNGFIKSGICPLNPNVQPFAEWKYVPGINSGDPLDPVTIKSDKELDIKPKIGLLDMKNCDFSDSSQISFSDNQVEQAPSCSYVKTNLPSENKTLCDADKKYQCKICAKKFKKNSYLRYHMRIHTGDRPYECRECGRSFALPQVLNKHLETHIKKEYFDCKFCQKVFASESYLEKHKPSCNKKNPIKYFDCKICSKVFASEKYLQEHKLKCKN